MHNLIIVPKYANDGTLNAIDLANDTLDAQYFTDKFNAPNDMDRWYPLPFMENVENTRAEALNETANSGNIYRIKQGARTLTGAMFKSSPRFLSRLENWFCIDFGVYEVDNNGALAGTLSADGTKLYPRYVLKGSFDGNYNYATDTTVSKIVVSLQYDDAVKDGQIGLITSENLGGADLLNVNGLLDVSISTAGLTTTGFLAVFNTIYGDATTPINIKGLLLADFDVFNVTQSSAVVLTSVTEDANTGTYDFEFPAQTSGDQLRIIINKEGIANEPMFVTIP